MQLPGRLAIASGSGASRWSATTIIASATRSILLGLFFLGILSCSCCCCCCHAYFAGGRIIQIQPRPLPLPSSMGMGVPKQHDDAGTGTSTGTGTGPSMALHKLPQLPQGQSSRRGNMQTSLSSSASSSSSSASLSSLVELETEIASLCEADRFQEAIDALEKEDTEPTARVKACYTTILKSLVDREEQIEVQRMEGKNNMIRKPTDEKDTVRYLQASKILDRLLELGESNRELLPTAEDFNSVIKMWGSSVFVDEASIKCRSYLRELWTLHNKYQDEAFVPLKESYYYAIRACSQKDRSSSAANRAQSLMNEMEAVCVKHPQLSPDRSIANEVLNAWGKSGQKFEQGKKCQQVLDKMIAIAQTSNDDRGRNMAPDTKSFNIVLNALAQGRERNSEIRAEELIEKMEQLSCTVQGGDQTPIDCLPDETSFNTVLNAWASSRQRGAADRAIAILEHMKRRHEARLTKVHPDESTYNTVLKALAKSRDPSSIDRAEAVFREYLEGCESGMLSLSHNAFTYNSMINCYAKSRHSDAGKRSLELFETMKANSGKPGWELCFVDVFTYTSLIDAISKQQSYEASEQAISLLEEFERTFDETGDMRFRPNIRLYTSTVNAIGRSHKQPDRAKTIVDRVESSYLEGLAHWEGKPDVVFYNALINAYGWSDTEGRSQKCLDIVKHMVDLYESGTLDDAKPDTVSFNSVLNACAHERVKGQARSDAIMKIVVEAFDMLTGSDAEEYGSPDQNTYVQVLICIANHMAKNDETRVSMAEATFLKCAERGMVSPNIVSKLHAAVPNAVFQKLMGPASTEGRVLRFDISKLPSEWTEHALAPGSRTRRTSSRRRQGNFQVTKNVLSHSARTATQQREQPH